MKLHGELNFQPLKVWPLVWYADLGRGVILGARSERERRKEAERAKNYHRASDQKDELQAIGGQGAG